MARRNDPLKIPHDSRSTTVRYRVVVVQFIQQCYQTPNIRVVSIDTQLLTRALELYAARKDKTWGLTDCISFVVMQEQSLTDAVTADIHFVQAGYRALMLE